MTMRKILLFLAFSVAAGAAQAQIKCWNQDGKRVCGDAPPPGAKVTTLQSPSAPASPAPAAKDAKKGPLTPAEQEQEYRKKQAESQKAAEKQAAENKSAETKRYNCAQAREALTTYESGQRVMRVRPDGERYFLDDAQIAQELAKTRQIVKDDCN
jgi:hypothetical protein